jgi:hypothetical protein
MLFPVLKPVIVLASVLTGAQGAFGGFDPSTGVATSGSAVWLDAAPSLVNHHAPSADWVVLGWREGTTTLTSDLFVNHDGSSGIFGKLVGGIADAPKSGTISAGVTVDSYMLHFNPCAEAGIAILAGFTFPTQILGLIFIGSDLANSDFLAPGTLYDLNQTWRGLELNAGWPFGFTYGNVMDVSAEGNHLNMLYSAVIGGQVDQVRVLTLGATSSSFAVAPEPQTIVFWLVLLFFGLAALVRRRGVDAWLSGNRCLGGRTGNTVSDVM